MAAPARDMGHSDTAADRIAKLIAALGMPARLGDCNVDPALHERIAQGALQNLWVKTNPEPITSIEPIMAMLKAAQ